MLTVAPLVLQMIRLLDDFVPLVLEHVDNKADLARCARVSEQWLRPARKQLYGSVDLRNRSLRTHVARVLDQSAHLRSFVRSAQIRLYPGDFAFRNHDLILTGIETGALVAAVATMPALVDLNVVGLPTIDTSVVEALRKLQQLGSFRLSQATQRPACQNYDGSHFLQICEGWRRLTRLALAGVYFTRHDWMSATGPSALTSLKIENGGLTESSRDTLTSFTYYEYDGTEPDVRHRRSYSQQGKLTEAGLVTAVSRLGQLQHLRLDVPALTAMGMRALLPLMEQLVRLLVPVSVIDEDGFAGASNSLKELLLTPPKRDTSVGRVAIRGGQIGVVAAPPPNGRAAAKTAFGRLGSCPLARVQKITLVERRHRSWCGFDPNIVRECEARMIAVEFGDDDDS